MTGSRKRSVIFEAVRTAPLAKLLNAWISEHDALFPQVPRGCWASDAMVNPLSARSWIVLQSGVPDRRLYEVLFCVFEFTPFERADALLCAIERVDALATDEIEVVMVTDLNRLRAINVGAGAERRVLRRELEQRVVAMLKAGTLASEITEATGATLRKVKDIARKHKIALKQPRAARKRSRDAQRAANSRAFGPSNFDQRRGSQNPGRDALIAKHAREFGTKSAAEKFDINQRWVRRIVARSSDSSGTRATGT